MLNPDLGLHDYLDMLNEMAEDFEDIDGVGNEVHYLLVKSTDKNHELLRKLIPDSKQYEKYLYETGFQRKSKDQSHYIDISPIWNEVSLKFNTDIWFSCQDTAFYLNDSMHPIYLQQ